MMTETLVKESKARSILKGLTWRILATATTFLLAWLFAKDLSVATSIAAVEFVIKFGIYYAHERAWQAIPREIFSKLDSKLDPELGHEGV